MEANKFATMLHRNTDKITFTLIYAVLEWILIVLLLLNSIFSHLIIKFAEFFGLKRPCLWCTRLDHIFDPEKGNKNMLRDLICEFHAKEISELGYCSNHHKLAELCEDCLSSKPEFQGFSNIFALFRNDKEMVGENGVENLNCSCCGVSLDDTLFSSYILLLKTLSWDIFECAKKEHMITKAGDIYDCDYSDKKISDFDAELCVDEKMEVTEKRRKENSCKSVSVNEMKEFEDEKENEVLEVGVEMENVEEKADLIMQDKSFQACVEENAPLEIPSQHLEFFLDYSGHKLVPVEWADSITEESQSKGDFKIEDHENVKDHGFYKGWEVQVEENTDLVLKNVVLDVDINEEPKFAMLESMEMEEDANSMFFHAKDCHLVMEEFEQFNNFPVSQFIFKDVRDVQEMDVAPREMHLDFHTACEEVAQMENNGNEADVSMGTDIPDLDITVEIKNQEPYERRHEDPSTSSANLYQADDQGPMQVCGTEESLDGSVTSDLEVSDGVVTIERLKSALRAERKALYAELEAERNASEVAANQTMAMINRLQEEKAAIQMEAFQYQRMMEEQSEYDQEALQLLNDLIVKREKEKRELEKELEVYKRKILDYETKEKIKVLKKSNFCSSAEDIDGLSIDLNQELGNQNSRVDGGVMSFEECLADFEDERLSILWQLQVLEEKLVKLDDDNEQQVEENGNHVDENAYFNGHENGFVKEMNGKLLFPLFDAVRDENGNGNGFDSNGVRHCYVSKFETGNKKLAIEEEMDHLFERLQAFEADRELFKHCVSSLRKGDKGMSLLQEILQHLRDLRNMELCIRNLSDSTPI